MNTLTHRLLYVVIAISASACAAAPPTTSTDNPSTAPPGIVIDSEYEDWRSISPLIVDPVDAPDAPLELGEVRITHDDRFVHVLFDVGRNVNLQGLPQQSVLVLLFDVDGDPHTGKTEFGMDGVDVAIEFSPRQNVMRPGLGVAIRSTTYQPPPENPVPLHTQDAGVMFAPTYAARRFELRIERGERLAQTPPLFIAEKFSVKLVHLDRDGKIADEVERVTYDLKPVTASRPAAANDFNPQDRKAGAKLRVLTWNIERGAIISNSEPFIRVLKTLQPDMLLLQEWKEEHTAEQLSQVLRAAGFDADTWQILIGEGGGDLRCVLASRYPIQPAPALQPIALPETPDGMMRAAAARVQIGERQLLVSSLHLRCCGVIEGPEDLQRISEAAAWQTAVRNALKTSTYAGVIAGGDLNLVGSRDPLELLAMGTDLDRSNLSIAPAYQTDALSNTTWRDRRTQFTPGRLDFMLYSDSQLELTHSFTFDSHDLSQAMLAKHGLQAADTECSDHLPVVLDVKWR